MGPTVVMDKSALQALSYRECLWLGEYYTVNLVPVFVMELLGDLKHPKETSESARDLVQQLANKTMAAWSYPNEHFRTVCLYELAGHQVEARGVPLVGGQHHRVPLKSGGHGVFTDVQPENIALLRWSHGEYDEVDHSLAGRWRETIRRIDLEAFRSRFRSLRLKGTGWSDITQAVDVLLDDPAAAPSIVAWWIEELGIQGVHTHKLMKAFSIRAQSFRVAAPYCAYCVRCAMVFYSALVHELIGSRATNRIDLEYFYYMPFSNILCSGDRVFEELAPHLLPSDKSFAPSARLKRDLTDLCQRAAMDEGVRDRALKEQAHTIEPDNGSLIVEMWIKHWGKWTPLSQRTAHGRSTDIDAPENAKLKDILDSMREFDARRKGHDGPQR